MSNPMNNPPGKQHAGFVPMAAALTAGKYVSLAEHAINRDTEDHYADPGAWLAAAQAYAATSAAISLNRIADVLEELAAVVERVPGAMP